MKFVLSLDVIQVSGTTAPPRDIEAALIQALAAAGKTFEVQLGTKPGEVAGFLVDEASAKYGPPTNPEPPSRKPDPEVPEPPKLPPTLNSAADIIRKNAKPRKVKPRA